MTSLSTARSTEEPADDELGRAVLVIGGGSGIGRATAVDYGSRGARVAILGRTGRTIDETAQLITEVGGTARACVADVLDDQGLGEAVRVAADWLGGLDVAINAAGVFDAVGPLADVPPDAWERVIAINLTGTYLAMRHEIAAMRAVGRGGSIVNLSSTFGAHTRGPSISAYAASKAAVSVLTRVAARDHLAEGIRINAVSPGPFDTAMSIRPGETREARDRRLADQHPAGRAGTMAEITSAIRYLASPEASYHVGTDLVIDGGVTA
jgi:NAD(P)-dependent dehydrogenase (short-subunit alcohol dehydrogenase family)